MTVRKLSHVVSPVALAVLVASCGGSGVSSSGDSSTPDTQAASPEAEELTESESAETDSEAGNPSEGTAISGRVADGYIQGATVCIDLNENDACDTGEPAAVTGEGGIYNLVIPESAEENSIVAAIPAEAIDEDSGEAVGQALVFIAPADQPEFVSPITTLVHQELQGNPNLDIEEAEDAVKALLGVEDQDISLFSDYVASGEQSEGESEQSDTYRFIHDTARVVTSLMKEIETRVGDAAGEDGTDVVGDADTQNAIRDIVRSEVSELLPDIARQVAASEPVASGVEQENTFDPDSIAGSLVPTDITDNVNERISAVIERVDPVLSDIQTVLTDGVYYMEFDCDYDDYVDNGSIDVQSPDEGATDTGSSVIDETDQGSESTQLSDADDLDEDGTPVSVTGEISLYAGHENCVPTYGQVQLDSTGTELLSQEFSFDADSGTWVEEIGNNEDVDEYTLVDGEWQALVDEGPSGVVEFDGSGLAIVSNTRGTMQLKAATQNVETLSVESHLLAGDSDPFWFGLLTESDLFSSGAESHIVSVNETPNPYVLYSVDSENADVEFACAEFSDNCNVIGSTFFETDTLSALTSLDEIRDLATQGLELAPMFSGRGATGNMSFILNGEFNDGDELTDPLPDTGSVEWPSLFFGSIDTGFTYPVDSGTCYAPEEISVDKDTGENAEFEQELSEQEQAVLEEELIGIEEELAQSETFEVQEQSPLVGELFQVEEELVLLQQQSDEELAALEKMRVQIEEELAQNPENTAELETQLIQLEENLALVRRQTEQERAVLIEQMAQLEEALGEEEQLRQDELAQQKESELELFDEVVVPDEDMINVAETPEGEELPIPFPDSSTDACVDIAARSGQEKKFADDINDGTQPVTTRWSLVEADGVTMIEVQLPDVFLHGYDDDAKSMLLIEHEGVVRQGAVLSDSYIGTAVTYNESAFITMKAIAERMFDKQ